MLQTFLLAGLQCVSGVVILVLICVGHGLALLLHQSYCIMQSHDPLWSSHVHAGCNPVSDVYTLGHKEFVVAGLRLLSFLISAQ